jgi:SsrA-binding protein
VGDDLARRKAPEAAAGGPRAGGGAPHGGGAQRPLARKPRAGGGEKLIARNRKAYHEYEVLEEIEAGLVLVGTEVKSLRAGHLTLGDAYARFVRGELFLVNAHIPEYKMGGLENHEPNRARKLLLHKREVARISQRIEEKGLTVIPLSVYWKDGYAKVKLGVCRGKKLHDKRAAIAARDAARASARESARD